ncbi:MAG: AI-2E family transporter [Chromatiales bacterium]|nr:AI-2E family transporter [Chromatiales bacterium]
MEIVRRWFNRTFSDPQVVILTILLVLISVFVLLTARMLAPVIASAIIAFILYAPVRLLKGWGVTHLAAVSIVFLGFLGFLLFTLLSVLPLLAAQLTQLAQQVPSMMVEAQTALMRLPERYPNIISEAEMGDFLAGLRTDLVAWSQLALSYSLASVMNAVVVAVYAILLPFMVFFFLKDGEKIVDWFAGFLPPERQLATQVWQEVKLQITNYVRGKFVEILIVAACSYVAYSLLGLNYAALLAVVTGLSVLIPYVGAALVTFPVALVAYAQWGLSSDFVWALAVYGLIQGLDGNVLAPLLLGDAVSLHPIAIIVAILFFGGLWGFWGVFFAIPLATVVQAVLRAWPRRLALAEAGTSEHAGPPAAARHEAGTPAA